MTFGDHQIMGLPIPGKTPRGPFQDLVNIPKVHILSIRQVTKSCGTEISTFKATFFTRLDLVSPNVFGFHEDPKCDDDDDLNEVTGRTMEVSKVHLSFSLHRQFWVALERNV